MKTFGGIEEKLASFEKAQILLQSIPYDGTSTWIKGADKGFGDFLEAAENMELFDIETKSEVYQKGIHILPIIKEDSSPESVHEVVKAKVDELLKTDKFLSFFGGEHSISIGIIDAYRDKYKDLSVLQIDAHADLRKSYHGSPYNHACALHKSSQLDNLVQVGIRSMDVTEVKYLDPEKCYFDHQMRDNPHWMEESISQLGEKVYLTIDLDAINPAEMPATGTPEPGGLSWHQLTAYLKMLFKKKEVVGFDIVEFAPIEALHHPAFLVAKLYYKILSYKFHSHD